MIQKSYEIIPTDGFPPTTLYCCLVVKEELFSNDTFKKLDKESVWINEDPLLIIEYGEHTLYKDLAYLLLKDIKGDKNSVVVRMGKKNPMIARSVDDFLKLCTTPILKARL